MSKDYSEAKVEALIKARQYFQYAAANLLYAKWRRSCINKFAFYDGDAQYPESVLQQLRDRKQEPIVVNKIKSMINQVSGIERKNRTRTAYRSHNDDENSEKLAKALSHYTYYVQENQNVPQKRSDRNKDALICGLGWSGIYKQDGQMFFENIHPLNILFDADDFSPQMTNQQYCIRSHWIGREDLKILYPKFSKQIDDLFATAEPANIGSFSSEFFNRISEYIDIYAIGGQGIGANILIVEVQRKQKRKYLCGFDSSGNYFETFDEKEAIELAGSENNLEEKMGFQILRTVFCRDIVLEHAPLKPNIPNLSDFLYIPCVYGRRSADALPDGWMTPMMDLQRILNYNKLKEVAMLNSARIIADANAFVGQTMEEIREELARSDSVLIKNPDSEVNIHPNVDLAMSQINSSRRLDEEFQQVSGMFSDALGAPSNATSGVAINSRARLSVTNQQIGFDIFELANKREAKMMLNLIQGGREENIMAQILTPDEEETIVLNLTREIDGKKVVFNDIRTLPLSIYVEQTHDYESAPEEQRSTFEALLGNQNAQMILQSPGFLKLLGIRDWKKISEEMQRINEQKQQMEQMANSGTPIPEQPNVDQSPLAGLSG